MLQPTPNRTGDPLPNPFPSLKAAAMLRILHNLGYAVVRQNGSHCILRADGRQQITFANHPGTSLAPGLVREILVKQAGLSEDEALKEVGAK